MLPHKTLSYKTLPHKTLPYKTLPHTTPPHKTLPHKMLPHKTLPHKTLPHKMLPNKTLPHKTLRSDNGYMGNVVRQELSSLHGGSLKLTSAVPLKQYIMREKKQIFQTPF